MQYRSHSTWKSGRGTSSSLDSDPSASKSSGFCHSSSSTTCEDDEEEEEEEEEEEDGEEEDDVARLDDLLSPRHSCATI